MNLIKTIQKIDFNSNDYLSDVFAEVAQHPLEDSQQIVMDFIGKENTVTFIRINSYHLLIENIRNELNEIRLFLRLEPNNTQVLSFVAKIHAFQTLTEILIVSLLGKGTTDKISFYHDVRYQEKVKHFWKENKSEMKKLLSVRNKVGAHMDNIFLESPSFAHRGIIRKCRKFLDRLINEEKRYLDKVTEPKRKAIAKMLNNKK